jgi:hypothetical protein
MSRLDSVPLTAERISADTYPLVHVDRAHMLGIVVMAEVVRLANAKVVIVSNKGRRNS